MPEKYCWKMQFQNKETLQAIVGLSKARDQSGNQNWLMSSNKAKDSYLLQTLSGILTNNEEKVESGIQIDPELFATGCEMVWIHDKNEGTLQLLVNRSYCGTTQSSEWLKKGKFYMVVSLMKPSKLKIINPAKEVVKKHQNSA